MANNATLAFVPDPVTCFKSAKYRQSQVFYFEPNANLVFVDWLTSGRKRNYLSTGSLRDIRKETLEHWMFDSYDTISEVFVGGERLVTDRVCLKGTAWKLNVSRVFRLIASYVYVCSYTL